MRSTVFIFLSALLYIAILSTVSADLVYRDPRVLNVTYSFEFAPDPATIDRAKDLKLWVPMPREWDSQRAVKIISVNPPQHTEYEDPEHGNPMLFWDFGKEPEKPSYKVEIRFRMEVYEVYAEVDPERVIVPYDKASDEYALYTQSGHTVCINPKIAKMAKEAVGDETNPYLQAKRIFEFVRRKMRFQYTFGTGIQYLLSTAFKDEKTGEECYLGDCGQYSVLFTALCRAVGIPARSVGGFARWRPWIAEEDLKPLSEEEESVSPSGLAGARFRGGSSPHGWAEFYIPEYGWIPVDATWRIFGRLDNKRIVMHKGLDVKIGPHAPQEQRHGYGFQWVLLNEGRVDWLQAAVWNIAKIRTARVKIFVASDPFPADGFTEYSEQLYPEDDYGGKLSNWRSELLEWIDWATRGSKNREAELASVYEPGEVQILQDAFVCHMLRKIVGDDRFFQIFREYEGLRHDSGEAVPTDRFQEIAEDVYGEHLDWFFDQWLNAMNSMSLPQLKLSKVTLDRDEEKWQIRGHLNQTGKTFFRMPVELALDTENGTESHRIWQDSRDTEFELRTSSKPIKLEVDADNDILKIQKMPSRLVWFWKAYRKMIIIYGTIAEADANKAAAERLDDEYLGLSHEIIKADTNVTEEDLKTDIVFLFGRPATNKIAQQFKDVFPVKFDESNFTYQEAIYDQPTQGVAQVVNHPLNPKGLLILYAGLSGEATLHVCDSYLYDAKASYVIFDGEETLVSGDWENAGSDLVWKFDTDKE